MTLNQYLLTVLGEEAVEVTQRCSKAIRFGLEEVQESQDASNSERISREFDDLLAVHEMLQDAGVLRAPSRQLILAKKFKVAKYCNYSRKLGVIK